MNQRTTQTENKLLTPEQAADLLQVSKRTMYEWLRNGEIPCERIGERLIRVRESDVLSPDARSHFEQGCKLAQHPETVERAAEFFNKAIAINPRYSLAYFELGRMFYSWGHYSRAIEPMMKAIELNPSFPAYMNLGLNYNMAGLHKEAEKVLRKALELMPENAWCHCELGYSIFIEAFNKPERQREAAIHFRKALELKPDYGKAAHPLTQILVFYLRDYPAALMLANDLEKTMPDTAEYIRFWVSQSYN